MVIAVRFFTNSSSDENKNFIYETFSRISGLHIQHTFLFIFDKPYNSLILPANVIPVVIELKEKSPMKSLIWYNIKIPAVLKKYKADIFISGSFCSLITKIPQILIAPDISFTQHASIVKKQSLLFYKKFTPRFLKKTKTIIVFSAFQKAEIIKQYKTDADKIEVIYNGVNENFKPIHIEEREKIKDKYAAGNEYFIYTGEIGSNKNLLNLLKAFSAFKKRQRSNMQLLIAGNPGWEYEKFSESLRLFRFKEDVQILENPSLEDLIKITAAAYALVYPSLFEGFATQPLQAMKSSIPVITSSTGAMPEIVADAALYADAENFKDIAIKMMMLFKDENLRKALIEKGTIQVKKYNWDNTAGLVWKSIEKTLL
jgi:glycosyltransferase involved in cell wall biosynthesis